MFPSFRRRCSQIRPPREWISSWIQTESCNSYPVLLHSDWNEILHEATDILMALERGDSVETSKLLPLIYDELRRLERKSRLRKAGKHSTSHSTRS